MTLSFLGFLMNSPLGPVTRHDGGRSSPFVLSICVLVSRAPFCFLQTFDEDKIRSQENEHLQHTDSNR